MKPVVGELITPSELARLMGWFHDDAKKQPDCGRAAAWMRELGEEYRGAVVESPTGGILLAWRLIAREWSGVSGVKELLCEDDDE